ncbi:MAG: hypothetical protein PHF67_03785 [Candidatus Nanoarchaeia archaeon]|nr:hypothetical protein [Candidatus Nanoarchaeia archaeon]
MEKRTLSPRKIVKTNGKLLYDEGTKSFSRIRLKKEIIEEFPQLRERRSSFSYELKFFRDSEELERMIKKLGKEENMPILMWLYKESY